MTDAGLESAEAGGDGGDGRGADEATRGLHPVVRVGWMLRAAVNALVLGSLAAFAGSGAAKRLPHLPLRPAAIALLVAAVALVLGILHAWRLFATWRWAVRPDDVFASYGVLWRTRRSIPRVRVQHVDVSSGPVDRALGIVHVSLHVAGALGPVLTIPGLAPAEAEQVREALLESARRH